MLLNMSGVVRLDVGMSCYLSIHAKQLCNKRHKCRLIRLACSAHERGVPCSDVCSVWLQCLVVPCSCM